MAPKSVWSFMQVSPCPFKPSLHMVIVLNLPLMAASSCPAVRSYDHDPETRILRPIPNSQLQTWLNFKTAPLCLPGPAMSRPFALEEWGLAPLSFTAHVVQAGKDGEVRVNGNMMVPVTVEGVFSPSGPGRCFQQVLSLTHLCRSLRDFPAGSCKFRLPSNGRCLSFPGLPLLSPQPHTAGDTLAKWVALLVRISLQNTQGCHSYQRFHMSWCLQQLWPSIRGACGFPDAAVCLASMSCSSFLRFKPVTHPYVPQFQGTHRKLSMWSQWSCYHCQLSLELASIPNHLFG